MEIVDLTDVRVDQPALELITRDLAMEHLVFPLHLIKLVIFEKKMKKKKKRKQKKKRKKKKKNGNGCE